MVGSLGSAKQAGMSGFDWVTYKNVAGRHRRQLPR